MKPKKLLENIILNDLGFTLLLILGSLLGSSIVVLLWRLFE